MQGSISEAPERFLWDRMDQLDSNQEAELDQTSTETEESGKIASEPSSGPKEWHQPAFNG